MKLRIDPGSVLHRIKINIVLLVFFAGMAFHPVFGINQEDFKNPPQQEYGLRCWWWWLNGNVDKAAITKDLEAMKAKGFSGAMVFDAGGATQGGHSPVPAGPLYGSKEWVDLFCHALNEARRLNLQLGLSIQSGWNLGGPNVTPEYAAKELTWSELDMDSQNSMIDLPVPRNRYDFYRDICVLAWPVKDVESAKVNNITIKASSERKEYPAQNVLDGKRDSFWVSYGENPGEGPGAGRNEWLELDLGANIEIQSIRIEGRTGYGPKAGKILIGKSANSLKEAGVFKATDGKTIDLSFPLTSIRLIRLIFDESFDPGYPQNSRNVQVTEVSIFGKEGAPLLGAKTRQPIRDLDLKAAFREGSFAAPDCRFLLDDIPAVPGEEDVKLTEIINITDKMAANGRLQWQAPPGRWHVMRMGYTCTNAHVSTSSGDWTGRVVDYLSQDAFLRYWNEIIEPIFQRAGDHVGTTLKQLETDSWECGGMNWTDDFASEFKKYCGYDIIPWLPVVAGKIVDNRTASNAFLADFRKVIADCIANNHYRTFAQTAHKYNLQIQPESGGPHSGPLDAIKNLGRSDIVMGEFWAPSPHRPTPEHRFYCKQASSVAHIYGKKLVAAEAFTTIGPHWNDCLWHEQKPSMDHEFCSGLNMIFLHTFTCSPPSMGLPGQEYFAGTHINPQVTWWDYSDPFFQYINRCHYMLRQGRFVADVLYYMGDHVPNLMKLKEADPAGVLPGYDYDATTEEILLQLHVENGLVVVPGGVKYRLLVLPDHKVLSMAALKKINDLLRGGATILGPKPQRLVSLVGGDSAQKQFMTLSDELWSDTQSGQKKIGNGTLIWGEETRDVLRSLKVAPDFVVNDNLTKGAIDYIHYEIDDGDLYFVCNQMENEVEPVCSFRTTSQHVEVWDPVTGLIQAADINRKENRTEIALPFNPYGSLFVIFSNNLNSSTTLAKNDLKPNLKPIKNIDGPWHVRFDARRGGPAVPVPFNSLSSWIDHSNPNIKYYSGEASYQTSFSFNPASNQQYWLDLGRVLDVGFARIKLNGKDLGVLWTSPHQIEVTSALRTGSNDLVIQVVNSWWNRMIGDSGFPNDKRQTNSNIRFKPDMKLEDSGLLGPVMILQKQ